MKDVRNKKGRRNKYWKISIFNERLGGFVIKCVCIPTKEDALIIEREWIRKGFITSVTPHLAGAK